MTFEEDAVKAIYRLYYQQLVEQAHVISADDKRVYSSWKENGYYWSAEAYDSEGFRLLYISNLFKRRLDAARLVFEKMKNVKIGLEEVRGRAIVSIGCGFGAELVAARGFLQREIGHFPDMKFIGVDPVRGWKGCFDAFNSQSFEFFTGKLSSIESEQDGLCERLNRDRAVVVILSHVVYDFAGAYFGKLIERMFTAVKTLECVVILERVVFTDYPTDLRGIRVYAGEDLDVCIDSRTTRAVVYKRETQFDVDNLAASFAATSISTSLAAPW